MIKKKKKNSLSDRSTENLFEEDCRVLKRKKKNNFTEGLPPLGNFPALALLCKKENCFALNYSRNEDFVCIFIKKKKNSQGHLRISHRSKIKAFEILKNINYYSLGANKISI